jgi:hypothetical protein
VGDLRRCAACQVAGLSSTPGRSTPPEAGQVCADVDSVCCGQFFADALGKGATSAVFGGGTSAFNEQQGFNHIG